MNINLFTKKKLIIIFFLVVILVVSFFFDKGLAAGILVLLVLAGITFLLLPKTLKKDNTLLLILVLTIIVHLSVTLFMHYANFQPFSGGTGDYITYQKSAIEISQSFRQGNFSIKNIVIKYPDLYTGNYYPVVMGIIYALTLPQMIVGLLFGIWLAVITILLFYLLMLEIGGTKKQAFIMGLIVNFYPSYLFYCSLLLKDTIVVPLAIASLLLIIKLIKKFLWVNFVIFYLVLLVLIHFRFYVGYAGLLVFIFCWVLFSNLGIKKRILYAIIIIPLLGFLPMMCGNGYFGYKFIEYYVSPGQITNYREEVYQNVGSSSGSTILIKHDIHKPVSFLLSYLETFIYALLGPFPWQIRYARQWLALFETIPWYILLFFAIKGIKNSIKKYKIYSPLFLFSVIVLAILALYTPNYGIITRIRIPAFIALLCFIPFGFSLKNKYIDKINNYLDKINLC